MENTGNFGTNLGLIFLFFLFLPTFFRILGYVFSQFQTVQVIHVDDSDGNSSPVINHTVHYHGNNYDPPKQQKKKKAKRKKKHGKKQNLNDLFGVQPVLVERETDSELKIRCQKALVKLGYKAREAKSLIGKLCINKYYEDEDELISDCFRKEDE